MRPLPVMAAFTHAVKSTADNIGFAWYVSWPWLAILLPILAAGNLYLAANVPPEEAARSPAYAAVNVLMALASMVAISSVAVNWHRFVLRDEVPGGRDRLRLDAATGRYLGNTILISLALGVGAFAVVAVATLVLGASVATAIPVLATGLVAAGMTAFYLLGIKLPAVALGRRDFGFRDAWRAAAGNISRILAIALLYFALAFGAGLGVTALGALVGLAGPVAGQILSLAVGLAANWLLSMLGITLLTSLYGYFVEGRNF